MIKEDFDVLKEIEVPANPFPGLRPFEYRERFLFFGRSDQSGKMIAKLSATRFLTVVGTSGSGKSSLARAGLLPALYGGFMAGGGGGRARGGVVARAARLAPTQARGGGRGAHIRDPP